ncbi:ybaR, partial [Symbiodinium necroappetens]
MANAVEGDISFAAGVFRDCFRRGGDFTVVVEEPQGEDSCGSEVKRVEFKVMSPLLASWSVVFDKMINSEEFIEHRKAQMVIADFSSRAVEVFLRFLYSGVVEGPLETLVEVCALADKYQVERLQELCTEAFRKGLKTENACQLFASAARFQLADLRGMALEEIWINPEDALRECPSISLELLEEILTPGLICMSNGVLRVILQGWSAGKKRKAGEEATLPLPSQPVIQRHFDRMKDEAARLERAYGAESPEDSCWASYSEDMFNSLWLEREEHNPESPFLGYYVNVVFGRTCVEFCQYNSEPLEYYVSNRKPFMLTAGSITWSLPYESVYLMGLSFAEEMTEQVHCKIFCSKDGMSWHLAADTRKSKIKAKAGLRLNRPNGLVKWFQLEVLEGTFYNSLRVQGGRFVPPDLLTREGITASYVTKEVLLGVTIGFAQVPESVAFAFLAHVRPHVALHAAWIIGLFCSLLGGRPGMVNGATGAFAAIIATFLPVPSTPGGNGEHVELLFPSVMLA